MSLRTIAFAIALLAAVAATSALVSAGGAATSVGSTLVPVERVGQTSLTGLSTTPAADPVTDTTEIDEALTGDTDSSGADDDFAGVNRTLPGVTSGNGHAINPNKRAKSNPQLGTHFQGLNFHDQRFANNGNQFSVEPPDQALCAGNGFILEAVNDVVQAYDTSGTPLLNGGQAVALNTFYGYPAAINRATNARGPSITDPTCIYDAQTNRFYLVVLTLDHVGTTASLNGNNHLDIAVSDTGNPTGSWTIYTLPVQNNGTQGTPNHHCNSGFCLGDYPHIGADANAIYLTTNEFAFSGPGFYGAQVYAIGKALLTGGTGSAVLFDTLGTGPDGAGFTVWPASEPGTVYETANGGTEYFLSSNAVFYGTSNTILEWTLTNSSSLNTTTPSPALSVKSVGVQTYAPPPRAQQKATGDFPLQQCLADTLTNCWFFVAGAPAPNPTPFNGLNSNDSRMGQVMFANGKLWGALGTAVNVNGQNRAGIAYYVLNPASGKLALQGQVGVAGTDLTYPEVGVLDTGRGVMSFTLTGDNDYPSAGYAPLDALVGMGDVHVASAGVGPWDSFTRYVVFGSGRPRWGDYGATTAMGGSIWSASEYVAQTCTYAQYLTSPVGQCGGTRAALGNWSTHVSRLTP
jgi:hypothetical protein